MSTVLILGAGVAGLTTGIYCLMNGHKVTICEQHTITGGNLTGWTREHLHIDNCIHWLTGTNKHSKLNQIWKDIGAITDDISLIKEEKLYSYNCDGQIVSLYRDLNKTIDEMIRISPKDKRKIKKLEKAIKVMERYSSVGGDTHDQGINFNSILRSPILLEFFNKTTHEYGKQFTSPTLKGFFEGLLGPEFSALAFVMVAATFCGENGDIPEGGSFKMAQRITQRYKELGGELKMSKKATNVNIQDKKIISVTFEDGETIEADNIVVTFEPKMFFDKIVKKPMPKPFQRIYKSKSYNRFSTIQAAFAIDEDTTTFAGTMTVDIPKDLQNILHSDKAALRESSYEKSYIKNGKKVIQSMIYTNEKRSKHFILLASKKDKEEYKKEKEELILAQQELIERQIPELKGKLKKIDGWTPASYARYVGTEIGSWMSFQLPAKKIPIFVNNKVKGIDNLYLASQWNLMPGGLPMAALAGQKTAKLIK